MRNRLAAARRVAAALRRTGRRFRSHLRPQLPLAIGATGALLLETLARIAEPWPIAVVLDDVLLEDGAAGGSGLGSMEPATLLILCALAVLLFAAVRAGASYLSTVGLALAGSRVVAGVRGEVFAHVQRLSLRYHSGARLGDLVTRLTYDIGKLQEVAITAALPLAANLLTLAGMLAVMLWIDWVLTLAALAAVPLFALPLVRRGSRIRGVARIARAMVRDAPVILLDEPTTGLGEHSERALREALRALCTGRTTFTAAHDLRLLGGADVIAYIDGGRIRERGTHAELLAAGGACCATWERQRADHAAAGGRGTAEVAR